MGCALLGSVKSQTAHSWDEGGSLYELSSSLQKTSELWSPQVALEWMLAPSAKLKTLGKRPTCGPLNAFREP